MQKEAFTSQGVIAFLQDLLREIEGKLLIIWDGAPIHHSKAIQQFLTDGAAKRILLERLPAYAPDLNPDEGIWHYLKQVELANVCCKDLDELTRKLNIAADNLADRPELVQACFSECGYY
jgi:transposase